MTGKVPRVRLVDALARSQYMLQLVLVLLVHALLERIGRLVFVRLERDEVLRHFVVGPRDKHGQVVDDGDLGEFADGLLVLVLGVSTGAGRGGKEVKGGGRILTTSHKTMRTR